MRKPTQLSRLDLVTVVQDIIDALYHDGPDTPWSSDTLQEVAEALAEHDLVPDEPPGEIVDFPV